jgi:hypothetical protein
MPLRLLSVLFLAFLTTVPFSAVNAVEALPDLREASQEMVRAAQLFWNALTPEQQAKAGFPMDSDERMNWHFIPKSRNGLPMKEMSPSQQHLATALLVSGMSQRGYMDAVTIMSLEQVLYELENKAPKRDTQMYHFSIFGTPDTEKAWAWRVEGHHLSVNFTLVKGIFISGAPTFFGANPTEVLSGPLKGQRLFLKEETDARALMKSLDAEQQKTALIAETAFKDIVTGADRTVNIGIPVGLPVTKMTEAQKTMLADLIRYYAARARGAVAHQEWNRIEEAGFDKIHFAWAGSLNPGEGHYYRIHGPTFLIEYDNTQNNANHVHSVWRDMQNDFGGDILKKHYAELHPTAK